MTECQEILDILQTRAEVYRVWDVGLKNYKENNLHDTYNEIVLLSTIKLKDIRELVKNMKFPDEVEEIIRKIEELEDNHLRANVSYHKAVIAGEECNKRSVYAIENEIMELIQEIVASYS